MRHTQRPLFSAFVISLLLLSSCRAPGTEPVSGAAPAGGPAPSANIRVQLNAAHTPQFAAFYLAVQKGYYAQEGLSVELIPASLQDQRIEIAGQAVLSGQAEFGVGGADMILRVRSKQNIADGDQDSLEDGQSGDLRAIASIYQINPLGILSLPGENIRRPSDLLGKKVGIVSNTLDTSPDIQLRSLLHRMKIDPAALQMTALQNLNGIDDLTQNRVQAASGFSAIQQGVQSRLSGVLYNQILYHDYGVPIYPNIIFTSGAFIEQRPDIVQRFIKATLRGCQAAIQDPQEAALAVQRFVHLQPATEQASAAALSSAEELQIYTSMALAQIPFIDPGYNPLGWMDAAIWQATQTLLLEQNLLPAPLDLEQAFTNRFVEAASSGGAETLP